MARAKRRAAACARSRNADTLDHLLTGTLSLHRAARDLERLLDINLFEKTSQGVGLTRAGALLAQHTKLAFAELAQGMAEVAASRGVDTGRIVVGSMPLARSAILPTAINALSGEQPDLEICVVDGPYADLLHDLRHGDVDFLIGALRERVPDDVVPEPLFEDPLVVAARAGHPLAGRPRVSLAELAAYPWVTPRHGTPRAITSRRCAGRRGPARWCRRARSCSFAGCYWAATASS